MHSSDDGLFPLLGYREQSCNGVRGARSLFRFLWINTQDWDCRVIPVTLFFASYAASILVSGVAAALCIPYPQCRRLPFSPPLFPPLICVTFLSTAILTGAR